MKLWPNGTVEGTPEELASYQKALAATYPKPWAPPTEPGLPSPIPTKRVNMCGTCQAKLARGEMAVCMCVLPTANQFTC
jgi:hypothetical protein